MNLTKGQIMMIHNMVNCELSNKNTVYSITELVNLKEQLTLTDVVKLLKDNEALTFEDWIKSNNYTDDFDGDFRKGDKIVGSVEVLKRYNKYLQSL